MVKENGFTLVEMLVIIVIIALLLMIILPAMHTAKEHTYNATCQSNLHHLFEILHAPSEPGKIPNMPNYRGWIPKVTNVGPAGLLICPKDDVEDSAAAVGIDGVTIISPPPSVVFNKYESNTIIHGFIEQDGYELPSAVAVNISQPGLYTSGYDSTRTTIPAGTVVDSYFVFFDPVGSQYSTSSGTVTLAADVLGLIVKSGDLDASDSILGSPNVLYPTGQGARGFESGAERVELENDMRTIKIHHFQSTFPGENMRILTMRGGVASYGMNKLMMPSDTRPGQILLVEYESTVVDPRSVNHKKSMQARHFGRVNTLYISGDIESLEIDSIQEKDWLAR